MTASGVFDSRCCEGLAAILFGLFGFRLGFVSDVLDAIGSVRVGVPVGFEPVDQPCDFLDAHSHFGVHFLSPPALCTRLGYPLAVIILYSISTNLSSVFQKKNIEKFLILTLMLARGIIRVEVQKMALSEAKRRSNDAYIAAHYERLPVSYSREFCAEVRVAAGVAGVSLAGYVRAALVAYMQAEHNGANHHGADQTEPPASDPAQAETVAPGADHVDPVKRKRGRPRKVQTVDMCADGMEEDAHNKADAGTIGAGATTPTRRKRGRPRKVNP